MVVVKVGLVGTGYAAKRRAEAFQNDARSQLVAVAGHTPDKTQAFAQSYSAEASPSWSELIARSDLDLIVVANVNRDRGSGVSAVDRSG
jgi:biliverdin reductase